MLGCGLCLVWAPACLFDANGQESLNPPDDAGLPFFAYGVFRPGQLAYFQLRDHVASVVSPVRVSGSLLERDGLPLLDPDAAGSVAGAVLTFKNDQSGNAYRQIADMEPDHQYQWRTANVEGVAANVLVGRSPNKGGAFLDDEWDGWRDPLFGAALDVVDETVQVACFDWSLKPLFRLQMAYLLLWTSIERYLSLRYNLGQHVMAKIHHLATEPEFGRALATYVDEERSVQRADRPDQTVKLIRTEPAKSAKYYYQIRSNITHRGKAAVRDHDTLAKSAKELSLIFRAVLTAAEQDAQRDIRA